MSMRPPVALSIAGSDPSGGAGIQADLKTFAALGAYGTTVITALTAQNTRGVTGVHAVPVEFVDQQLATLVSDVRIDAVKVGMLASAELVELVGRWLSRAPLADVPIVLDPVMVATAGSTLLEPSAVAALREILPLASLITPNIPEAAALLGTDPARSVAELREQAEALLAGGVRRVLLKGGHLDHGEWGDLPTHDPSGGVSTYNQSVDVLADRDGVHDVVGDRIRTANTHGTGCTLSSAIAALRPQRQDWLTTVTDAKAWLTEALRGADRLDIGSGSGPVDHAHGLRGPGLAPGRP